MKPLYNKSSQLVGWLSNSKKYIFDLNLHWVGFISKDNTVWCVRTIDWVGTLYGSNIRDTLGLTAFWNPETPIQNTSKPPVPKIKGRRLPNPPKRIPKPLQRPLTLDLKENIIWSNNNWNFFFHH
ncbi:MAG: 4-fold beta flower protein [Aquaticitalea sp.]